MIALASGNLANNVGFDLSVGLQSSPLSASTISSITSTLQGVANYKFFGHTQDHDIALEIINKSSTPNNIKFYIQIASSQVNTLSNNDIETLLLEWDDVSDHIYCIALGNEPEYDNGITFSILPDKLRLVYEYLQLRAGWEHVVVSIPFSGGILESSYPVPNSYFQPEYQANLTEILSILQQYGGPFSINWYSFFVLRDPANLFLLNYCLGNESSDIYNGMIEAQYQATWYAMNDLLVNNGIEIVITETGWASASSEYDFATISLANQYILNTLNFMNDPSSIIYGVKIYFFELFDEDLKGPADLEQHFGIYDLNGNIKYNDLDLIMSNNVTTAPTPATLQCGYIPISCDGDLNWAVTTGSQSNPEYYPNFYNITGIQLVSTTEDDMVVYWVCTQQNPNGNCFDLQLPCNRTCISKTTVSPTQIPSNPTSTPITSTPITSTPTAPTPLNSTNIPTTKNPTTSDPTTSNPTTSNPTTSNPTTSNPTNIQTTNNPTTSNPTNNPITSDPTTSMPTTNNPTTTKPTSYANTLPPEANSINIYSTLIDLVVGMICFCLL